MLRKIPVLLLCICNLFASAEIINVSANNTSIELHQSDGNSIRMSAQLGDLLLETKEINNQNFIQFSIPKFHLSNEIGSPQLPEMHQLIEMPQGATPRIVINNIEIEEISLVDLGYENLIAPVQPSLSKSQNPDEVDFILNSSAYSTNEFRNQQYVSVVDEGTMRYVRIGNLFIHAVDYNPVSKMIRVVKDIDFTVHFDNANHLRTRELRDNYYSPYFEPIFNQLINYDAQSFRNDDMISDPATYVIIANSVFNGYLDEFIEWKTQKGYIVDVAYTNEIGTSASSIRAYLLELYNNPSLQLPPPSFVLLVGDTNQLPASYSSGGHVSDLDYCDFTGDNKPDIFHGRFSAQSPTQLTSQINKTIEYEKYEMADPSFLGEVVMIAGVDASYAPTYGNGQINYGTNYYFNSAHDIYSNTYLYPASASSASQIRADVNNGVGYVNYTAHGYEEGWADPSFTNSNVNSMTNNGQYPLMVGNCCLTNAFDSSECFGEALLRASNKGAIGYIGGSDVTYWNEDYWWGVGSGSITANPSYNSTGPGAYDGAFHDGDEEAWAVVNSAFMYLGNMAVVEAGGSLVDYYWEIYHLMGDPSLSTYFGVPDQNDVTHDPFVPFGLDQFTISADPHSYVGVSKDGILHGSGFIGESGTIDLDIDPIYTAGEVLIVVTSQNKVPYMGTALVGNIDGAYVVLNDVEVSMGADDMITAGEYLDVSVVMENIGNEDASTINVSLSSNDEYISIVDGNETINSLGSESSATVEFTFQVANGAPYGYPFSLLVEATSDGETWSSEIELAVGSLVEGFEAGNLSTYAWEFGGLSNWSIDMGESSSGLYSVRSGYLDDAPAGSNVTSELSIVVDVAADGSISFDKKVSCEDVGSSSGNYYDYLAFYIDGVEQSKWAGEIGWSSSSFNVNAGEHTFTWLYNKDQGVVAGDDAVWIDNIVFPPCTSPTDGVAGDLNYDDSINVLDVIILVNMILGTSAPDYAVGDMNLDGQLNVLDVVIIVSQILE